VLARTFWVLVLTSSTVALAQPSPADAPAQAGLVHPLFPPVQLENIGLEEGLPQAHVTAITQDKQGFLWVGTQAGGVARYDGSRMLQFATDPNKPETLSSQFVTTLQADPSGKMWIGTGDAGLNVYDPATNQITRFRHDDKNAASIGFDGVTALEIEPDGTLWIGLGSGGLDRYDAATKSFVHVISPEFAEGEITSIQSDGKGQLWAASKGGGVFTIANLKSAPKGEWLPLAESVPRNVTALLVDSEGTLWFGTEDAGLFQLPKGAKTPIAYMPRPNDRRSLSSAKVVTIFEDRDKHLWVGTQYGLNEIDPTRKKLTRFAPDAEYPLRTATYPQYVTTAFQDTGGVLWFGTLELGLYKLDKLRRAFRNYGTTAEFGNPQAFCEAKDGIVWGATYSHGLYAIDFANEQYTAYPAFGPEGDPSRIELTEWLTAVHCSPSGKIWLGGSGLGLVMFDPAKQEFLQYPADPEGIKGPTSDRLEHIVEDANGVLYLAGWGGGLSRFDPKTKTFLLVTRDERVLPSSYLHRLMFDVKDPSVLWVGMALGGVARLDLKSTTSKVVRGPSSGTPPTASTLSDDNVLTLYQEPTGKLWIGTDGGGLDSYDPATGAIVRFGRAQGLPSDVVYGILRDDDKHLWLTTSKGLVRFDMATSKIVTFTQSDGLGSTEFNQNGYYRMAGGDLLVSTLTGFNRLSPKEIVPDEFVPPVVFTRFRVFDKDFKTASPIWTTSKVGLRHSDSAFTVDFAALAFAAPKQTRYQYMLEGFRNEWLTSERGELTFTNLDAGNYTLKVRAINRHGVANTTTADLKIRVEPPWWRSKPAYAIYLALLIAAGVLVIYIQRQRMLRVEREGRLALVEQELQLTGAVQSGFLPDNNEIQGERVQVVGFYKPADSCSGDW